VFNFSFFVPFLIISAPLWKLFGVIIFFLENIFSFDK